MKIPVSLFQHLKIIKLKFVSLVIHLAYYVKELQTANVYRVQKVYIFWITNVLVTAALKNLGTVLITPASLVHPLVSFVQHLMAQACAQPAVHHFS